MTDDAHERLARALVLIAGEWGISLERACDWLDQDWSFAEEQVEPDRLAKARRIAGRAEEFREVKGEIRGVWVRSDPSM